MKFTNKQIETTKSNVLRTILTNMKPQIQKGIDMAVLYEEKLTSRVSSEFSKECIEASLLFDLYKSVVSYTNNDDKVKEFKSGMSIKGNFELSGVIVRDGVDYGFITEAIIANGMINRAHYRYITKTNLPNARNQQHSQDIHKVIKGNNKKKTILDHLNNLNTMKNASIEKVEVMSKYTRQDWINQLEDGLIQNNWNTFSDEQKTEGYYWSNEQQYVEWLNGANQKTIEMQMERLQWAKDRVQQLTKSITKETIKLDKLSAL